MSPYPLSTKGLAPNRRNIRVRLMAFLVNEHHIGAIVTATGQYANDGVTV